MIRIVLVDDHNLFREGVKAMLHSASEISVVGEASTAGAGLEVVQRLACDLVIADFALPDYEAPWLIGQLRKRAVKVPVLMLSQHTDVERVRQILALGANGYVVKTAKRDDLLSAISIVAAGGIYVHPAVAPALLNSVGQSGPKDEFSSRERAILQLLVEGLSNPAISKRINVSLGTVKGDLQSLFGRLAVKDRTSLVAIALSRGLVEPPTKTC
jgi:DNA-binding NarL/FixJ family response regulator